LTNEVAVYDQPVTGEVVPARDVVDGWTDVLTAYTELAAQVVDSTFIPKSIRGDIGAVVACWLTGRELGIGPMMSLRHVQVVDGTPSLSSEYKRASVLAAGHKMEIIEWTTVRCTIRAQRRGMPWTQPVTYTIQDAEKAGLVKPKGSYMTRPRRMLFARASAEIFDALFPDITMGLPTTEIVQDGGWAEGEFIGEVTDAPAVVAVDGEPAQPVQRRTRKPRATAAKPAEAPELSAEEAQEESPGADQATDALEDAGLLDDTAEGEIVTEDAPAGQLAAGGTDPNGLAGELMQTRIKNLVKMIGLKGPEVIKGAALVLDRELKSLSGITAHEAMAFIDILSAASKSDTPRASFARLCRAVRTQRLEEAEGKTNEDDLLGEDGDPDAPAPY
jgi:hypothetical protein